MLTFYNLRSLSNPKSVVRSIRHLTLTSAALCYLSLLLLDSCVVAERSPQYDRSPPGVPPRLHQQDVPPSPQKNDIKFHDPSEYQKVYESQKKAESEKLREHHKHGIGEEIDADHMKQHTKEKYVDFSKMSESEVAIHHFRQFDLDDNGRVDGLEVLKKIQMDASEHGDKDDSDIYIKIVDNALDEYDENKDGYIYYAEFYKAYTKL